jgi:tetratricopeptide (TPR) repeat protein
MAQERLSPQQEAELRNLLTAANLSRMRGKWLEAEDTYRKAVSMSPRDIRIRSMLIDVLVELGKTELAISEAKAAMQIAPGNAQIETKYAKLVLERGEAAYQMAMAQDMLENPHKYVDRAKNPSIALLCAVFGLGQLYNHEFVKAGIIIGTILLFTISFFVLLPPAALRASSVAGMLATLNPFVEVLGAAALVAWIYGIVDALVTSNKGDDEPKKHIF